MTLSTLKCAKITAMQKKLSIFVFQYGTISIPDDRLIGWFMIFNPTFNNISVILPFVAVSFIGEGNHWSASIHWQTLSHNVV